MNLVWFRRDLRCDDNPALQAALRSQEPLVAMYTATPVQWQDHNMSPMQADLIFRRLLSLKDDLSKLDVPLLYRQVTDYDSSVDAVLSVCKQAGIKQLFFNKEYEHNEQIRDKKLAAKALELGISVSDFDDKCLLIPGTVTNGSGDYYKVFTPFKKACLKRLQETGISVLPLQVSPRPSSQIPQGEDVFSESSDFAYPRESSDQFAVASKAIIQQLRDFVSNQSGDYKQERDFPAQDGTSRLSPYLAIGALSVRQCAARLFYQNPEPNEGQLTWLSELIWRDFYQHLIYFRGDLCKGQPFHAWGRHLQWEKSLENFERWKQGETGYPIVDAAMRQMNTTGWMHNRLRMIVASFLVKDLHIDWRLGEAYFMSKLIDGDYASNNGGWQWCASTGCDGQPYFRIFNPITQGEKFDPSGDFVRRWVPELAALTSKQIHTPWKWVNVKSLSYPEPIVDHSIERKLTLEFYNSAKGSIE